jgi:exopolyphosphatase/guanosine-5'-triphosphate,3'-diphosphate pyrophosphatase
MKEFIKTQTKELNELQIIGSGGNINKAFSISKTKDGKPLSLHFLKSLHRELAALSIENRMTQFNLRKDRAMVLEPALYIFNNILKWSGCNEIFVPKIGLADGIIKKLYQDLEKITLSSQNGHKIGRNAHTSLN